MKIFVRFFILFPLLISLILYLNLNGATYAISEQELAKKRQGIYPIFVPFVNYNTDFGVGFFLGGFLFNNQYRTNQDGSINEDFNRFPYYYRIGAQFFLTTLNQHRHVLNFDMPKFFSDKVQFTSEIFFLQVLDNNYFGVGSQTIYDQNRIKERNEDNKTTESAYYKYTFTHPTLDIAFRIHLIYSLYLTSGLRLGYVWTGSRQGAMLDNGYTVNQTLFDEESPMGQEGGWDNHVILALALDGRDYIPYPSKGYLLEFAIQYYPPEVSTYHFSKLSIKAQHYLGVIKNGILANRLLIHGVIGRAPFYNLAKLGGHYNLRGFVDSRFLDQASIVFNHELRWRFLDFKIKKNRFYLTLVPFFDHGQVFSEIKDISTSTWRYGYGGELLVTYNLSTIINFTFGGSEEGFSFALDTRLLF